MMEVIKLVGKYLNVPVGPLCYNTDKIPTTVLDKQSVEGFATIILHLTSKSGYSLSQEELLLSYQWLEHIAMYSNQASSNPTFAKNFLQGINRALEKKSYLTGNNLTTTDIAVFYVVQPLVGNLTILEQESLLHLSRWCKHVQAQPRVCSHCAPIPLNTLNLHILAPAVH
ncbi:eukaryotic translation elongation factor 1 epsilon-1 [Pieris napi]|uniref:eukaryotic translation elongation factor 1 epsilon-1 n=1 Tax=Pieris napi TaxID=78633 RepID=UPI001FB89AED|nr:eukaryotic translation elongation factor 1 epsilon-1 [Pieris napi]